jgi:hypothetical protein
MLGWLELLFKKFVVLEALYIRIVPHRDSALDMKWTHD